MRTEKNISVIFWTVVFLIFQPFAESILPAAKYFDEILSVAVFGLYIYQTLKKGRLGKTEAKMMLWLVILLVTGLISNKTAGCGQPAAAVLTDMLSNLKLYLFFIPLIKMDLPKEEKLKLSDRLNKVIRWLILIMFCCALVSQVVDIGMTDEVRYGIKSFKFLLPNPAGLNTYFYTFMVIFSATMIKNGKIRPKTVTYLAMAVFSWVLTLRSRAFAFALCYVLLFWFLMVYRKKNKAFKFKWYYAVPLLIVALILGWPAFEEYFMLNTRQARYVLLRGAIAIAGDYMPFGSGFATFGTAASRTYYSPIYGRYGMANVWGISVEDSYFITDQYWCGILGQFGVLGLITMGALIYMFYKIMIKRSAKDPAVLLASVTLVFTSLLASVAAATYIQSSILASVGVVMALSEKTQKENHDKTDI